MADVERLTQEFLVCGITGFNGGFYEGAPVFSPTLISAKQAIANLVYAAHVEDVQTYLARDMRNDPDCLALYNAIDPVAWDAYRLIQAKYIRHARRQKIREAACLERDTCNDLMIKWLRTGEPADKTAWLLSMQTVNNAIPYPSGQAD